MTLKTVKDIPKANEFDRNKFSTREGHTELIDKKDLKQLAIKWVKYFGTDLDFTTFTAFHNITGEDLK